MGARIPHVHLTVAGGEPTRAERGARHYGTGVRIRHGSEMWTWVYRGQVHYSPISRYPRRSELAQGITNWSYAWKAQEFVIDTIARPDDRRAFHTALQTAIGLMELVAELYATPHSVANTPVKHICSQWLLGSLLDLEERFHIPGFRLDGERWMCIDWPEWHADWRREGNEVPQLRPTMDGVRVAPRRQRHRLQDDSAADS